MYPTLYEAFQDLFGLNLPFLQIVMTFGFFVAMGFLAANWVMILELKRMEADGDIHSREVDLNKPNHTTEYLSNLLIGFVLGWKVLYLILNFQEVVGDPQGFIVSGKGSVLYGVLLGLGFVVYKYYQIKNRPPFKPGMKETVRPYQMMGNVTLIAAVAGFAGAKIFHHLENWDDFIKDPIQALSEPFSGLTFYGGLICGAIAVLWYAKRNGVPYLRMLDIGGPAMMLAYGVGRMGCHFSGDGDWGTENLSAKPDWLSWLPDWAWAYDYPNNVLNQVLDNPVWPTPMYEVIMAFILFAILWSFRKRIKVVGVLFGGYLIFSGIERYIIEKIRVNPPFLGTEFTQAEIISVLFVLTGVLGIIILRKRSKSKEAKPQEVKSE